MALTVTITPKELERQAALAFEGQAYKVFLVSDPNATLDETSTLAEWEALELAEEKGYAPVTGTVAVGSYSTANAQYEIPAIEASFTGLDTGYTHDVVILSIGGAAYPHSVMRQSDAVLLQASQSIGYKFRLIQDD
jgi:hypothetical protein